MAGLIPRVTWGEFMLASLETDPVLRIETLGRLDISFGGRQIKIRSQKAKAMIAYVALADHGRESRRRLVGMFWGNSPQRQAQQSLRHCVGVLRRQFRLARCGVLGIDPRELRLDQARVRTDIAEILESVEGGVVPERLLSPDAVDQSFLADLDGLDEEFDTWLMSERSKISDRILRSLERQLYDPRRTSGQIEIARSLLRLDPTHDEATRALMRAYAAQGDLTAALRVAKAQEDVLVREHGTGPTPETRRLTAEIRECAAAPVAGGPVVPITTPTVVRIQPRTNKLVIMVAPLAMEAVSPERRYLCDGFRRELIASLILFREWHVRDGVKPTGEETTADEYALEAHASETRDGLRLVFTLKEGGSNEFVWSERLLLSLGEWTTAQQSVVRQLASSLNVSISEGRLARVVPQRDTAPLIFDQWLKGQQLIRSFRRDDWHEARRIFEEIIQAAPDFGPAYSSRAQLENIIHLAHHGLMRDAKGESQALDFARRAIGIDRGDSRAQLSLAWSHLMLEQFDLAARHYEHALRLNDNDPWTTISSGLGLAFAGDHARARRLVEAEGELAVGATATHLGYRMRICYLGGDIEDALEAMPRASDVPAFPGW
ncbi:MAG TPA: BTAD domain-containing putative transcriptional regulator, partial [Hyphomicrobiaceae bacterium]|nr:BTAD domain-containing putative transcriptional regulator [Hyphomicrobiaceae bacterium]